MPIPSHVDIFLVSREMSASDDSALKAVTDVDVERKSLEAEAEVLAAFADDGTASISTVDILINILLQKVRRNCWTFTNDWTR
jgi:hypothetical protein